MGFPCGSAVKVSTCNSGDLGSISGLEGSPGEGKGYPLQYSGLENSVNYSPGHCKESDTTEQLHFTIYIYIYIYIGVLSHFSCVRLCDPMNHSSPGSSVHKIFQAREL